jgi:cytochrome P450/NADPH-cytochrome P450 reductase
MHNAPLLVLYGSNSGTCEELASVVAGKAAAAGFAAKTASLDSVLKPGAAPLAGAVLVVTSTYNGTPPDNAAEFSKWLPVQAPGNQRQACWHALQDGSRNAMGGTWRH